MSYSSSFGDRPRGGVGAVLALIIVIAVTLVAFHVTAAGVFDGPPAVRLHVGSHLAGPRPNPTDHRQVDETAKLSITKSDSQATSPACNYKACSEAYRSFDASDCSYQPYTARAVSVGSGWCPAHCSNPLRTRKALDEAPETRTMRLLPERRVSERKFPGQSPAP
jgi:hypothetical protein